jgi:hypothetical protein
MSDYARWSGGPTEKGSRCGTARTTTPAESAAGRACSIRPCQATVAAVGKFAKAAHAHTHELQQSGGTGWCGGAPSWCAICPVAQGIAAMLAVIAGRQATNDAITTTAVHVVTHLDRRLITVTNVCSIDWHVKPCSLGGVGPVV